MIQSSQRIVRPRLEREVRLTLERNAYRHVYHRPVREPLWVLVTGIVVWFGCGLYAVSLVVRLLMFVTG